MLIPLDRGSCTSHARCWSGEYRRFQHLHLLITGISFRGSWDKVIIVLITTQLVHPQQVVGVKHRGSGRGGSRGCRGSNGGGRELCRRCRHSRGLCGREQGCGGLRRGRQHGLRAGVRGLCGRWWHSLGGLGGHW